MKKVLAWVLCLMLTLGMVSVASAEFAPVNKDDLKVGFVFIGDVSDNDDGGVARAGAEGRGAGGVGGFDHRAPAGGNDEIAPLHQLLRDGAARAGGSRLPDHLRQLLWLHELHG